jgi:REP element-mobilizing transposase RayT
MGRPLRIEYPGALYHITSRGNEKKKIFLDDADRLTFLEILKDYHDRYGILIHSYVLMDNPYHLILEAPRSNLLKVMHGINGRYTGYFNRRYKRFGHLFQGRYKGILVEKDAYLLTVSRYVHLNPVRARVVKKSEQYRWSSYPGYLGKEKGSEWVEYSWVLSQFSHNPHMARKKYWEYTEEGLKGKAENPLKGLHGQVVLGGNEFIQKIKGMFRGKPFSREIIERKRFTDTPLPDDVIKVVAKTCRVKEEAMKGKGRKENTARKIAIYLVQRHTGLSNDEIGKLFGGIHYSAVSKACARLKEEMTHNRKLSKLVEELESNVKT